MEIFCVNFSLSPSSPRREGGRGREKVNPLRLLLPEDVMRCRRGALQYTMRRRGACESRNESETAVATIQIKGKLGEQPKSL